nr:NYN domain-containing protein [Frankia gtarii]
MRPIFEKFTNGDGFGRLPGLLSVGSRLTLVRMAPGWLRRRMAEGAAPMLQGALTHGGELLAPRQPASADLAAFSSDSPSVGGARLAVLIDADNAQASLIEQVLAEVATLGTANVKRAYGDWTGPNLKSWKEQLLTQSIQPIQQFAYVTGKNATDAAMVIDAMDLLYRGRLDGFCLVSPLTELTAGFAQVSAGAWKGSARVLAHDRRRGGIAGSCRVGGPAGGVA